MSIPGQHIVEKVMVDVEVTSTELANRIKAEVSEFIQNEVLPIIETYFDEALPAYAGADTSFLDRIVQLNKLELSIDADSWNVDSNELREKVRAEVEDKLRPLLQTARDRAKLTPEQELELDVTHHGKDEVTVMTTTERLLNTFVHFLKSGTLPWWVQSIEESRSLFSGNKLAKAIAEEPEMVRQLLKNQLESSGLKDRLVKQFQPLIVLQCMGLQLSEGKSGSTMDVGRLKQIAKGIPQELSTEVLAVSWKLLESNDAVTRLSQKELAATIFRYGQLRLFQHADQERRLENALKLTFHTMIVLNGIAFRDQETIQLKKDIIASLEAILIPIDRLKIQQTPTYQSEFFGSAAFEEKRSVDDVKTQSSSEQETRLKNDDRKLLENELYISNQSTDKLQGASVDVSEEHSNDDVSSNSDMKRNHSEAQNTFADEENIARQKDAQTLSGTPNRNEEEWKENKAASGEGGITFDELDRLQEQLFSEQNTLDETKRVLPKEMFVQNVGLVLLNPFLPALFKQLELLGDDKQLTNPELVANVLHYAATGREGDYEFEMTFEKYLCGLPPSMSLKKNIVLTQAQKDEVDKMLGVVLEYWSALKSQSIELVRNEFLSRPGKWIIEKNNHRLIVERKAFDLLLDKLPWSYSMIKFSWLEDLLFVEW